MTNEISRRTALFTGGAFLLSPVIARAWGTAATEWGQETPLPLAIQEIYPAAHQGRIHVAGGLYAEGDRIRGATDRHFSWAPGDEAWQELGPLPDRRHHPNLVSAEHASFFIGEKSVATDTYLVALGGFTSREGVLDWTMSDSTLIYNPDSMQWQEGPLAPEPHGETVCAVLGEYIHVVGGRTPKGESNMRWQDHIDSDRHLLYHPLGGYWDQAAPALTKRNSAAGAVLDGNLHVVGGRVVNAGNLTTHEVWDAQEDRWRTAAPMPQGQGGLAAASLGGRLYAFGGEFFDNGGGVYPEVWVYNPVKDQWMSGPDMPTPRHGLGAVTLGDVIHVIGGAIQAGGDGTSTAVETLRAGSSIATKPD